MGRALADEDSGLAPERTVLAWNRTGMAFLVAIAAIGRRIWPINEGNHPWVLLILGVAGFAFLASLFLASRLATQARYRGDTIGDRAYLLVTLGTLALALAGFALAFSPP